MRRFTGTLIDRAHSLLTSTPVFVVYAGTDDLADLFNENLLRIGNPVVTDESGSFSFYTRSGVYDFLDANNVFLQKGVQIFDFLAPAEWAALWDFPPTGFIIGSDGRQNIYVGGETLLASGSAWKFGGSQIDAYPVITLDGNGWAQPFISAYTRTTDFEPVFEVDSFGRIKWGPGANFPADLTIQRKEAGRLEVIGALEVTGEFWHRGTTLGFYNATPIPKPFVTLDDLDIVEDQSMYELIQALNSLGLIRTEAVMIISAAAATIEGSVNVSNALSGTAAALAAGQHSIGTGYTVAP